MQRRLVLAACLIAVLSAAPGRGDWRMRIHKGATVEEHPLADMTA